MSAPNLPEVQIITDDTWKTIVKVLGFFSAATSSNTVVVQANTLFGANTSAAAPLPLLSVARVLYSQGLANGYIQLQFVGKNGANNADIINLGSRTSGDMPMFIPNALASNAASTTGDINLNIVGAEPNDAFSLFITLNKDNGHGGWANAYIGYNASDFPH
jgi:hypothetical protein